MPGITGQGTTFNLPNFHGELFQITPLATPLLSATGGLTGGRVADAVEFEWQVEDLRTPDQPSNLEGQNAPTAAERVRARKSNVVQIFHEAVEVSYTKMATPGQFANAGVASGANPVQDDFVHQVENALRTIARDVNHCFINGTYAKPADNSAARRTRGLLQYAETNVVTKGTALVADTSTDTITVTHALNVDDRVVFTDRGAATGVVNGRTYWVVSKSTTVSFKVSATKGGTPIPLGTATGVKLVAARSTELSADELNAFVQLVFDNGGLINGTGTLLTNSSQKVAVTKAIASAFGKAQPVRGNIGGVNVTEIETDFGVLSVMIDRAMPQDALALVTLEELAPRFLNIPGKGSFFVEELAKTGASSKSQLYGEIGLELGAENHHGVMRGLAIPA
jgi:hypothetical protein